MIPLSSRCPSSWRLSVPVYWASGLLAALIILGVLSVATARPASGLGLDAAHAEIQGRLVPPDSSLDASLAEVDSMRDAGAYRDAFSRLSSLKNQHPGDAGVLYRLALTWVDIGEQTESASARASQYKQALSVAQQAIEADSTSASAHLALSIAQGRVALEAGTREQIRLSRGVKRHADQAIALDSTLAGAYHVRARWNREVADLGFFQRTIVKTVYGGLPDASFEQAVRDFQTAIRHEDAIVHHLELARTYLKMDREDEARQELQAVLDLPVNDPDDPRHKRRAKSLLDEL